MECKESRKHLISLDAIKDKEAYQKHLQAYKALLQKKRRRWEVKRQLFHAQEKAHACSRFWRNLKDKRVESFGDLNLVDMYMHYKNLYEQPNVGKILCHGSLLCVPSFFTVKDVRGGLKKLATRKAGDLQGFKSEMLKWTREETHIWICDMFNLALQHGMPHGWSTNWIKPLHRGRCK
ncbi:hypothetical protein L7F22_017771 [Adiantum nelumboides]|nr:hypothetical protein [Adiantum nelumboides]